MKKILSTVVLFLIIGLSTSIAQEEEEYVNDDFKPLKYEDRVYKESIKTVQFQMEGLAVSQPIVDLRGGGTLLLAFDELGDEVNDYYYTIIHCNADWTPTEQLTTMDYIDGFSNEPITQETFSFNTLTNYVHYEVALPNQDFSWTKSGNYLLKVFQDEDENNLVLTRQFMVVDQHMNIRSTIDRANSFTKRRTHQEIDFIVNHKGIRVSNPQIEIKVAILQNGRWDNAITGLKPLFIRPEELLYDYQNTILFEGGKEFRYVNLQSFRYRTDRVKTLLDDPVDGQIVQLFTEQSRANTPYLNDSDINGHFIINNEHENDPTIEADYAWVHFSLAKSVEIDGGDVYIFGKLTDWQIDERFRMKYNIGEKVYQARVQLKQGFYNYQYAFVNHKAPTIADLLELEGSSFEANNEYMILVYFRPYGTRYDQLVAVQVFQSRR